MIANLLWMIQRPPGVESASITREYYSFRLIVVVQNRCKHLTLDIHCLIPFLKLWKPVQSSIILAIFFWDNQSSESDDGFHSTRPGGNAPCLWLLWRPQLPQSTRVTLIIKDAAMSSLWYLWRLLGVRIRDDRDRRPLSSEAVVDRYIYGD